MEVAKVITVIAILFHSMDSSEHQDEIEPFIVNLKKGNQRRTVEVDQVTTDNLRKLFNVSFAYLS